MVFAVVAIDEKRGLADDNGIPWDLPTDKKYFRDLVKDKDILMGYGTYVEFTKPMTTGKSFVATSKAITKSGFIIVDDPTQLLQNAKSDIWVIGGAGLFDAIWQLVDILYVTQIKGDFGCTKFMPVYTDDFVRIKKEIPLIENGATFWYEVWERKKMGVNCWGRCRAFSSWLSRSISGSPNGMKTM